jgi:hypothetical protein
MKELTPNRRNLGLEIERDGRPMDNGLYVATDDQLFHAGKRILSWDGCVYKYSYGVTTMIEDRLAWQSYSQHIDYGATVAATTVAGDSSFKVDISAAMGKADDGVIAEDELMGGRVIVYSDTIATIQRGIVGNSAVATGEMTLYVDAPIDRILTVDASFVEAICNPWRFVSTGEGGGVRSMVGLPNVVTAATAKWLWLQTWGPCWVAPQGPLADAAHDLEVVARSDGSVQAHEYGTAMATLQQHVGFILSHAANGTQGAPFWMMQISPC